MISSILIAAFIFSWGTVFGLWLAKRVTKPEEPAPYTVADLCKFGAVIQLKEVRREPAD